MGLGLAGKCLPILPAGAGFRDEEGGIMMLAKSVRLMIKAPKARLHRAPGTRVIESRKSKERQRKWSPSQVDYCSQS